MRSGLSGMGGAATSVAAGAAHSPAPHAALGHGTANQSAIRIEPLKRVQIGTCTAQHSKAQRTAIRMEPL